MSSTVPSSSGGTRPAGRVVVISNRLPVEHSFQVVTRVVRNRFERVKTDRIERTKGKGGLVVVLLPSLELAANNGTEIIWLGSALSEDERRLASGSALPNDERVNGYIPYDPSRPDATVKQRLLDVPQEMYREFYDEFANTLEWLTQHGFEHGMSEARALDVAESYKQVNQIYATQILDGHQDGDTVWINDYHFMYVGKMLADALKEEELATGHKSVMNVVGYWHIPHAGPEAFATWPADLRRERFNAMTYTKWGFHSNRWADNYVSCVMEFADEHCVQRVVAGLEVEQVSRLLSSSPANRVEQLVHFARMEVLSESLDYLTADQRTSMIEQMTPQTLSELVERLDRHGCFALVADMEPEAIKAMFGKLSGTIAEQLMGELSARAEYEFVAHFDLNVREVRGVKLVGEEKLANSTAPFVAPATLNPDLINEQASHPDVDAAMTEIKNKIMEANGGEDPGKIIVFVGRKDPKNGEDLLLEAAEALAPDHNFTLVTIGQRSRKGVPAYDELYISTKKTRERVDQAHPGYVVPFEGVSFAHTLAAYRLADIAVSPSRRGGRDVVGAEPALAKQPGDKPLVNVTSAEAAISETVEGINGANVPDSAIPGNEPQPGSIVVQGLNPEHSREGGVQALTSALKQALTMPQAEVDARFDALVHATGMENGEVWSHFCLAQAMPLDEGEQHTERVLQVGYLPQATSAAFRLDLLAKANAKVARGEPVSTGATKVLAEHGLASDSYSGFEL